MNEAYSEVREQLRRQHAANTSEVQGRNAGRRYNVSYNDGSVDADENAAFTFSFKTKLFIFMACIMLFSCYLYGGQDVKKGAVMAWNEINGQITELEEEQPYVKQAMDYVRDACSEIKEFAKTYMGMD